MLAARLALASVVLAGCASGARPPLAAPPVAPTSLRAPRAVVAPVAHDAALDRAIVEALRPDREVPSADPDADGPLPVLQRVPPAPPADEPAGDSDARLPPESIQRVVRASSGRFRACYQRALVRDHTATGHVITFFVIGSDGLVDLVQEEQATLSDRAARECVQRAYFSLHFPKPPGGRPITVLYPMHFGPGPSAPVEMPHARRSAEAPPPGFAERFRSGVPVPPEPVVIPFEDAAPPQPSPCASGDPMCADL
jgi:hypothetical protein